MKIGFIGAGNMASAIVRGVVAAGLDADEIYLTDRSGKSAPALATEVGAHALADNHELAQTADVIVLGVKPHAVEDVLKEITPEISDGSKLVISLAAGKSLASLQQATETNVPIVRVMPNVNAAIGESMTGIARGAAASSKHVEMTKEIMVPVGRCLVIDEGHFPIFSALAGCSPAWMYQIVDDFARAGVNHGLTKHQAVAIVAQSMLGSAQMILDEAANDGATPANLIDRVTSPGGTTIAGLLAAQQSGLSAVLGLAVDAAVARDGELG